MYWRQVLIALSVFIFSLLPEFIKLQFYVVAVVLYGSQYDRTNKLIINEWFEPQNFNVQKDNKFSAQSLFIEYNRTNKSSR